MSSLLQLSDVGELVQDRQYADFFRTRVADLLGRNSKSFPGAQPVSFARKHLRELQKQDYYLCEKTDGIRCLLYLTFHAGANEGDDSEVHFLIDRKNDYYHVPNPELHFPVKDRPVEEFQRETLLDGELVMDILPDGQRIPRYLVFDCLALDRKPLLERTLDKRLAFFLDSVLKPYKQLLDKFPEEKQYQPFFVEVKKMEKPYSIAYMFDEVLPNLPHGNDGLIFTCRMTPYTPGTDQYIVKWKPPEENTVDFRLQLGAFPQDEDGEPDYDGLPTFDLLVFYGDKRNEKFAPLYVTEEEWEAMKGINQMLDGRIIECFKDDQGRWRYKHEPDGSPRFRDDKSEANHISTVQSVLESIDDAVTKQDLLNSAEAIRLAWKPREAEAQRQEELKRKHDAEEYAKKKKASMGSQQPAPQQ